MRLRLQTIHRSIATLLLSLLPTLLLSFLYPTRLLLPPARAQTAQDHKPAREASLKEIADRLFQQGIQQGQSNQYQAAVQSFEQALGLYRKIQDRFGEAVSLIGLSEANIGLGNATRAAELRQQAVVIARELNNPELEKLARETEAARLLRQGIEQYKNSQFEAALNSWQQALQIYREIKDRRGEGAALGNLGNAYDALGDYGRAVAYQEQSLAIARDIKDRQGEGKSLGNLGNAFFALGDFGKAIAYYEQSLAAAQEIKNRQGEGESLGSLGNAYHVLGDYGRAIAYQEQSLAIARDIKDRQGEGKSLGSLGNAYFALGDYGKAIAYYEQRLAIAQEIKDRRGEGAALGNLGLAYRSTGNYGKAIVYHEQSLAIARKIKDRRGEGNSLGSLGLAYHVLGNYGKAIEYYEQSLAIAREIKDRLGEVSALNNLGLAYGALGNYGRAIEYQEQSLAIAREIKDRLGEGNALNNLGYALFKSGNLTAAAKTLMDGIVTWELLRQTGAGNDANKVSIFEQQARTYRRLQEVLVAQNQPNSALEISERGRARAFVELLAQRVAGSPPTPLIKGGAAGGGIESGVKPPNLQQIQQIAKAQNATLVQYSILYDDFKIQGKEEPREADLYIWVVPPTGEISFRKVDLKPLWQQQNVMLANLVVQSRQAIGARGRSDIEVAIAPEVRKQQQEQQTRNLKQLHELLIQPIADLLPKDPNQRVIFIPQRELFLVPFPALLDANGTALIEQHTILSAPSIQVLELTRQQRDRLSSRKSVAGQSLIIGNPTMPKVVTQLGDTPVQLSDLPGAKREALEIAKLLNTQAITGGQATEAAIVQQMPTARLIHFATHGLLDDVKGLGVPGAIALAPSGTGELNDGLLTSNEILDMKLNAELVVLSACDTGRGRITGDGVIGLSRSLITAGVPSIVVSLWKVPDDSTAFLMTEFYKNLRTTNDKAQALRQAMLTTKQKYPDPLNWAAFTLIGEAE